MSRICPGCKSEVQDSEILCPVCGAAVPRDLSKIRETDGETSETDRVSKNKKREKKGTIIAVLIGLIAVCAVAVFLFPRIKNMNRPAYEKAAIEWMESEFERIITTNSLTVLSEKDSEFIRAFQSEDEKTILVKCYLETLNSSSGAEEYDLYYIYVTKEKNQIIKEDSKCVYYSSNKNDVKDYAEKNTPDGYTPI